MSPLLESFGNSSSRGYRRYGPTSSPSLINVRFNANSSSTNYSAPSNAQLQAAETYTLGNATTIGLTYGNGFRYFSLNAGSYTVTISGANGSGTQHGYGIILTGTLTLPSTTNLVALVGHNGTGSYSGGGMSALAIGTSYTTATALFVAGGGGGGYSSFNTNLDAKAASTAVPATCTDFAYDSGAGFTANGARSYSGSGLAQSFRNGGQGGVSTSCGSVYGGFGGGGGSCPAGGGGYVGGYAGGNSPSAVGGSGGSSYWDTTYISGVTTVGWRGSNRTLTNSTNATVVAESGYITITKV